MTIEKKYIILILIIIWKIQFISNNSIMKTIILFLKANIHFIIYFFVLSFISFLIYLNIIFYWISIVDTKIENELNIILKHELIYLWFFIFLNAIVFILSLSEKLSIKYLFTYMWIFTFTYLIIIFIIRS